MLGERYIAVTDVGAPRGRLVAIALDSEHPNDPASWQELLPESAATLRTVTPVGDLLYLTEFVDTYARIRIADRDGRVRGEVPLPERGAIVEMPFPLMTLVPRGHPDVFVFGFSSLTASTGIYSHAPGEAGIKTLKAPAVRLDNTAVEDRWAVSSDGARIPYHLVRRADVSADRPQPTLIYAYGGFNAALAPHFPGPMAAFVAAGGVFVHAHLRGGAEFGRDWWEGGRLRNKQNCYQDLYAVAEHLIADRRATPQTLAVTGGSNGGLMAGVAVTQRPELWKAVVPRVPLLDLIGACRQAYGRMATVMEFADVDDPAEVRRLAMFSPYQLVRDGVEYPAVFIDAGDTDPRCPPWHSRKFIARLQAASSGRAPILMHVWENVGHGWATDKEISITENSEWLAFVLRELGVDELPGPLRTMTDDSQNVVGDRRTAGPLESLRAKLTDQIAALCPKSLVPGYLLGIAQGPHRLLLSHGIANLNSNVPMTVDTAYLLGSITKVMTTALLLRYVERGRLDLDSPAARYLPDFRLKTRGAAQKILVRQLVNHTNGLDADVLMPDTCGDAAVSVYIEALRQCGVLFPAGSFLHYTNPGMSVAGRIIEVLSGKSYNRALEEEIFAPIGMVHSCTSAKQAIRHRIALGSLPDAATGTARPAQMFMLPESGAAAGATPIVTIEDLLSFGQTLLAQGLAPNGNRVLSRELADLMTTPSFDLQTPNAPPIGLGWWLTPIAGTTTWWHGGGSPGGTSTLAVFPEHDLVIVNFGNGAGSPAIHDPVIKTVLEDYLGLRVELPFTPAQTKLELQRYTGSYASHQFEQQIEAAADGLRATTKFVPMDEWHAAIIKGYGGVEVPPADLVPIHETLFAPKGPPLEAFAGIWGRMGLTSFHDRGRDGRYRYSHSRFRAIRRVD